MRGLLGKVGYLDVFVVARSARRAARWCRIGPVFERRGGVFDFPITLSGFRWADLVVRKICTDPEKLAQS